MSHPLIAELHSRLHTLNLIEKKLVVAISGGPDSLALTVGLASLREDLGLQIHLAHLNHQLRPESGQDAAFVQEVARLLNLPVSIGHADVREVAAREHMGIEEAGRLERYRFLSRVRKEVAADAVVVGHTQDDQTETRLMHVVRGAGLRGLVGMAEDSLLAVPGAEPVRVVRPLLNVRRAQTESFCRDHGVTPRVDASNRDRTYTRNRLRHEALPALRSVNPQLDASLARLARCAEDAADFVESELDRRLATLTRIDQRCWTVDRAGWRELHPALKRALLQRAAAALADGPGILDAANVEDGIRAADSWGSGRTLAWPGGLELRVEHDHIAVRRCCRDGKPEPWVTPLPEEGKVDLGALPVALANGHLRWDASTTFPAALIVRRVTEPCPNRQEDRWHCDVDGAKLAVASSPVVRSRRAGDWLLPEGMSGRKKVQDLLVDAHIPREERDRIPIVASTEGVVWVVGLRRDRRFLAGADSQQVLCFTVDTNRSDPNLAG